MSTKRRRSGFTLPEVLVTVTVVAVLAAVVVPAVTQYSSKGDTPTLLGDIDQVRSAVTAYVADVKAYPATFYDLVSSSATGWKGPYFTGTLVGTTGAGTYTSGG